MESNIKLFVFGTLPVLFSPTRAALLFVCIHTRSFPLDPFVGDDP